MDRPMITRMDTTPFTRKWLDLPYANVSASQKLDLYLPEEGEGQFPAILVVHGGAFMMGDKGDSPTLPMMEGLKRGYAVISINYRMSGEALFPALVHDIKAAIRWVRANAAIYNLAADKIGAWGSSAGGWLVSMAGVTGDTDTLDDRSLGNAEQSSSIQAAVVWYGPTDFLKMDKQVAELGLPSPFGEKHTDANSPESLLLGAKITEVPDLVMKANPETYISPAAPPFLFQHGTLDDVVPCLQSVLFADKLEQSIGWNNVRLELIQGGHHGDIGFETPDKICRVYDFFDHNLKK